MFQGFLQHRNTARKRGSEWRHSHTWSKMASREHDYTNTGGKKATPKSKRRKKRFRRLSDHGNTAKKRLVMEAVDDNMQCLHNLPKNTASAGVSVPVSAGQTLYPDGSGESSDVATSDLEPSTPNILHTSFMSESSEGDPTFSPPIHHKRNSLREDMLRRHTSHFALPEQGRSMCYI